MRQVLKLYQAKLTHKQIAAELGMSNAQVRVSLYRLRKNGELPQVGYKIWIDNRISRETYSQLRRMALFKKKSIDQLILDLLPFA